LKKTLVALGALIAVASSLLPGCIDPGPAAGAAPHSLSGTARAATVSWDAPTSNTNGTPLTDLIGYRIYYGSNPGELVQMIRIGSIGMQTYVIDDLEPGTWYFAVVAVAANGLESSLSDVAVKTIT
jgi:Fibronectin type III domain